VKIKKELENHFHSVGKYLFVDISHNSILSAVNSNPKYFSFDYSNASIKLNVNKRENLYDDVYCIFNAKINLKIKFELLKTLETFFETIE